MAPLSLFVPGGMEGRPSSSGRGLPFPGAMLKAVPRSRHGGAEFSFGSQGRCSMIRGAMCRMPFRSTAKARGIWPGYDGGRPEGRGDAQGGSGPMEIGHGRGTWEPRAGQGPNRRREKGDSRPANRLRGGLEFIGESSQSNEALPRLGEIGGHGVTCKPAGP